MRAGWAGVLFAFAPAMAFAQQQQFGQSPPNTYVTWGSNANATRVDVTYFIGTGFAPAQVNLINQAAAQWSAAGAVNLIQVGSAGAANVQLSMANVGTAALSQVVRNTSALQPGTIHGAPWVKILNPETITVSSAFSWWNGTGAQGRNQFDFQAVILDLMGYSLGMGFVPGGTQTDSVMQPAFNPGVPGNHSLSSADIASIQAIYGAPEPVTLALFGFGLSLVGLSRLRRGGASRVLERHSLEWRRR